MILQRRHHSTGACLRTDTNQELQRTMWAIGCQRTSNNPLQRKSVPFHGWSKSLLNDARCPTRIAPQTRFLWAALLSLGLFNNKVSAQSPAPGGMPPPSGMSLAESAAMRFPQPVRAGDLLRRNVLEPVESQHFLGTVKQVVRGSDGTLQVVIDYGGFLGFGARPIAVPVDAMVLVGRVMEVVAYTPEQLRAFPTFSPGNTTPLPADSVIKVGLAKPSH